MLARPRLKRAEPNSVAPPKPSQAREVDGRYVLKVDGQVKASFEEKDVALNTARTIKRAYPIVVVVVTDVHEETTERIS